MNIDELRKRFLRLRENGRYIGGDKWDAELAKLLPVNPTPAQYVEAAEKIMLVCDKPCNNGLYQWGAFDLMTKKSQFSAKCFRCGGRGKQNHEDHARNRYFDNHRRAV